MSFRSLSSLRQLIKSGIADKILKGSILRSDVAVPIMDLADSSILEFDPLISYATGQKVVFGEEGIFRCLSPTAPGQSPATSPLKWKIIGPPPGSGPGNGTDVPDATTLVKGKVQLAVAGDADSENSKATTLAVVMNRVNAAVAALRGTNNTDTLQSIRADLAAILTVIGPEAGDGDTLVNTVREMLTAFQNYAEGVNVAQQFTSITNQLATLNSAIAAKFTLPSGGNSSQYINGLGQLAAFPAITPTQGYTVFDDNHGFAKGYALTAGLARARAVTAGNQAQVWGIVTEVIDADNYRYQTAGDVFSIAGMGLAANTTYWLADTASGVNYTATRPTTAGQVEAALFITSSDATKALIVGYPAYEIVDDQTGSTELATDAEYAAGNTTKAVSASQVSRLTEDNSDYTPADSNNSTGFFKTLLTSGKLKLRPALDRIVAVIGANSDALLTTSKTIIGAVNEVKLSNDTKYSLASELICFGDSITFGVGASTTANSWASKAALTLGLTLVNKGISGTVLQNTPSELNGGSPLSNNGRDRVRSAIIDIFKFPGRVYILYGLNDLRYAGINFTVGNFENDLEEVVRELLASGMQNRQIVLGSPPYMNPAVYGASNAAPFNAGSTAKHVLYVAAVRRVAAKYGVRYADVYQAMINGGGNTLLDADGIHPNDAGHQAIATAMVNADFVSFAITQFAVGASDPFRVASPIATTSPVLAVSGGSNKTNTPSINQQYFPLNTNRDFALTGHNTYWGDTQWRKQNTTLGGVTKFATPADTNELIYYATQFHPVGGDGSVTVSGMEERLNAAGTAIFYVLNNVPVCADNAAAITAGVPLNGLYRTPAGDPKFRV